MLLHTEGKQQKDSWKKKTRREKNNKTFRDMSRCSFGMLFLLTLCHGLQFFLLSLLLLFELHELSVQPCLLVDVLLLLLMSQKKMNKGKMKNKKKCFNETQKKSYSVNIWTTHEKKQLKAAGKLPLCWICVGVSTWTDDRVLYL